MASETSRRNFIKSTLTAGTAALISLPGKRVMAATDRPVLEKKLGIALVGLGIYSTHVLAPALQETENCYLAGIVTGTPEKEKIWADKYNIPKANIYNYENFDSIANNPNIDIIYIVLPNSMHEEYTIRAAKAGKDVICEKPMAMSVKECQAMIDACKQNNVTLSVGYRLHYEPHNQEVARFAKSQKYGKVRYVHSAAAFVSTFTKKDWRLQKAYGGGVLMDMGIYPILGARYATGAWPLSVTAQTHTVDPELYDEVEAFVTMQMEFPDNVVADLMVSFNSNASQLYVEASKGWCELLPFSGYRGIHGRTSEGPLDFPQVNQQALQMDDVAWCIANKKPMRAPGEEGMRDMHILEKVRKAIKTGKKIDI